MERRRGNQSRLTVVVAAAIALTACDAPPASEQIKADISAAVAEIAPTGLFTIESVRITDVQRHEGNASIQYAATLRLSRDYAFDNWDQVGVTVIAHTLGAAAVDIHGVKQAGNLSGDFLRVNGRANYTPDSRHGWKLNQFGPTPAPAPPISTGPARDLWDVVRHLSRMEAWETLRHNIGWAVVRSHAQLARNDGGFSVASGPSGSNTWSILEALRRSETLDRPVVNLPVTSDEEIHHLLRDGTATAAIIDSDDPGGLAETMTDLRAVAALFPKQLHVIVKSDSRIASVVDLRARRIVITAPRRSAAGDALNAYRITETSAAIATMPLPDGLHALADGTADAVIATAWAPEPNIAEAVAHNSVRLLGLDGDAIALLTTGENRYLAINIPAHTYPHQQNPITTVATVAMIVAPATVSDREVTTLLEAFFTPLDFLSYGSAAGMLINRQTATRGLTLPLHPMAETFFNIPAADR